MAASPPVFTSRTFGMGRLPSVCRYAGGMESSVAPYRSIQATSASGSAIADSGGKRTLAPRAHAMKTWNIDASKDSEVMSRTRSSGITSNAST